MKMHNPTTEREHAELNQVSTTLRRKHTQYQMLFWSAIILVHLVLFFFIPDEQRDASVLWISLKWGLLVFYAVALFLNVRRFVRLDKQSSSGSEPQVDRRMGR
jgi:hypothetical protein